MKANIKNTKGNSTMKKLVPAAGMLMISASMLATSTFAWFTMSREVELKNINVTASAPINVQMSLGYNQHTGALTAGTITEGTNTNGVKLVKAPDNSDMSEDWSNMVNFYDFYQAPMLTPASSNTGGTIFTTHDATVVGKTVNAEGASIASTEGTLHLLTASDEGIVAPTNDATESHYIDFPVWFRTSDTADLSLSVRATVKDGTNASAVTAAEGEDALFKSARVSILGGANAGTTNGVIIPYDSTGAQGSYYVTDKALAATGTLGTQGSSPTYDSVSKTTQNTTASNADGTAIITLPGRSSETASAYTGNSADTSDNYGAAVCVIVRVWLEGEDVNCWNATAGQDFCIDLKFTEHTT